MRLLDVKVLDKLSISTIRSVFKCILRSKSSNPKGQKSKRYSNSLNLPQTTFPLSMKNGAAAKRETEIQKTQEYQTLYTWQRQQNWENEFILHDGPPYANGKTHVGHAVNKVLKDITNRYKVMRKHKVHYVPGWDCHGMPIEIKAISDEKGSHKELTPLEIRAKAKKVAEEAIQGQMRSFKRWGIMADWEQPYLTFNTEYQTKQLEMFYKIFENGFVYRDYMPVYWSPSSGTALAEAELEYKSDHVSKSVYLAFPLLNCPEIEGMDRESITNVHAVIWTTTPWTLPFNQAISYNSQIGYVFLRCAKSAKVYLCDESFVDKLKTITNSDLKLICKVDGKLLKGTFYKHPLNQQKLPFLAAAHVLAGKGTGLVHTAPAHGHDDFQVALQHQLPVECYVDEHGTYTSGVDSSLLGKQVGKDADEAVMSALSEHILQVEDFIHSYPYDWRTKKPVIIRASQQWFINVSALRESALKNLAEVKIHPPKAENGMLKQLQLRSYWCISRQRSWGVPIPVFYHKITGEPLITKEIVGHVCKLIKQNTSDCWWSLPMSELLPDDILTKLNKGQHSDYIRGNDILDIWFDSGVSWASVLNGRQADLYLEGNDQFQGWFQTSLLTSVAVNGRAPYKQILTHSFATDENGKKMSKSLGNVIDPNNVINGGKDKKISPSYGVDVLRWWVARNHHRQQINIGPTILDKINEHVFKMRKCLRFLIGNLYDFDPNDHCVPYHKMTTVDKYALYVLYTVMQKLTEDYDSFQYTDVIKRLENYVYEDLSSFYINITRDRCYCSDVDDESRRSSQTVQYYILKNLTSAMAPVLPHLAEELSKYVPGYNKSSGSIFKQGWCTLDPLWRNVDAAYSLIPVFDIKRDLMTELGTELPSDFDVFIYSSPRLHDLLRELQPEMTSSTSSICEVLQTAQVTVLDKAPNTIPDDATIINGSTELCDTDSTEMVDYKILLMSANLHMCERCRRYTTNFANVPCDRCLEALGESWAK